MSVLSEEDSNPVKIIGVAGAGFFSLSVVLVILEIDISAWFIPVLVHPLLLALQRALHLAVTCKSFDPLRTFA
jgi:hypothetical protein